MFRIFGPKKENVTGGRTKLGSKELHNLHFSPNSFTVLILWRLRRAVSEVSMELI
jgi:hypothetical protein